MNIRNMGACAMAALALLSGCDSDPAAFAAANAAEGEARDQMKVMADAADGSAAAAVGDLMADPVIQEQLGMSVGPTKVAPAPEPIPPPTQTPVDPA